VAADSSQSHHCNPSPAPVLQMLTMATPTLTRYRTFAWSLRMAQKAFGTGPSATALSRFCIQHQAVLYFPLLFFARMSMGHAISGLRMARAQHVLDHQRYCGSRWRSGCCSLTKLPLALERVVLLAHYGWYFALMAAYMTPAGALTFFLVSQLVAGFLLALVFGVGHNGMSVIDADTKPGFAEMQASQDRLWYYTMTACPTADAGAPPLVAGPYNAQRPQQSVLRWFMGGLECQIEHHLFPTRECAFGVSPLRPLPMKIRNALCPCSATAQLAKGQTARRGTLPQARRP